MKKILLLFAITLLGMAACAQQEDKDIYQPQKNESIMNTESTHITLTIGKISIPATLNNTQTAQAFIKHLPFSVTANRGEFDYCGTGPSLPCNRKRKQDGNAVT